MEMPTSAAAYVQAIEGLLETNEIEKAIVAMLEIDKQAATGLRQEIIQQSAIFSEATRSRQRNFIGFDEYSRQSARVSFTLLELLKDLRERLEANPHTPASLTFPFEMPNRSSAEKSAGSINDPLANNTGKNEAPKSPVPPPAVSTPAAIPKFVVVYDQADIPQCQTLNKYLNILKITKKVRVYNVQEVFAQDLLANAEAELADADYLLALVTVNLFNSPDWFGLVLSALEHGRRVIPIRIEKIGYEGTGLERLLSLPTLNRAVSDFPNIDAAYADIVAELRKLLPK